jgi:hypothetical protein
MPAERIGRTSRAYEFATGALEFGENEKQSVRGGDQKFV